MKKFLSYFFIVFGLVALWMSTSRRAMQFVADNRGNDKWWGGYPCLQSTGYNYVVVYSSNSYRKGARARMKSRNRRPPR